MKKQIAILGSTGSIGKSLFNILKKDKKNIQVILLTGNKNYKILIKQALFFRVKNVIISDYDAFLIVKSKLKNKKINVFNNYNNLEKIFTTKIDYLMSSISGIDGLEPTLKCIQFSRTIAIANKESIICGWSLIKNKLKRFKTKFIPIDSEHFSIWSLIYGTEIRNIKKIYITASGGPFKNLPLKNFKSITINSALKHPNWKMGKKITIDSATLMNKVFEVIEAKKIFETSYNKIEILIHPKSYVHAIINFKNGLTKILLHDTTMEIPIFNSLNLNTNKVFKSNSLDFKILNNLNFTSVNYKKFPLVNVLALMPDINSLYETVLVSTNDTLVKLFLEKKISLLDISKHLIKIIELKEFQKYKNLRPMNIRQIKNLYNKVSLKVNSLSV